MLIGTPFDDKATRTLKTIMTDYFLPCSWPQLDERGHPRRALKLYALSPLVFACPWKGQFFFLEWTCNKKNISFGTISYNNVNLVGSSKVIDLRVKLLCSNNNESLLLIMNVLNMLYMTNYFNHLNL